MTDEAHLQTRESDDEVADVGWAGTLHGWQSFDHHLAPEYRWSLEGMAG